VPNFAGLVEKKDQLVRKALDGSLFCADMTADPIGALTGDDRLLAALPTGYTDGGLMTDEGMRMAREVETEDITSFGRTTPTRSDVSTDVMTLAVDFQELSKTTIGLYTGIDMSTVAPDPVSGEIQIPKPARPTARYYRLLALAVDENEYGELYVARFFPRARTTDYAEQAFAKGAQAINWGMTFTSYVDETIGASQIDMFGGDGWVGLLADMGFDAIS
jgi:hypothetical protein